MAIIRVTRLHLILTALGVLCLFFGVMNWISNTEDEMGRDALMEARKVQQGQAQRQKSVQAQVNAAGNPLKQSAAQGIAVVGEAYQPLCRQFGDVPPISRPLRAAKRHQATGHYEAAIRSTRESWLALKAFRTKAGSMAPSYHVVRGDTLWRIAQFHSPAKAGEGWVTIWKANKALVGDFNRLEVGWTLTIPQQKTQYVMPFWQPK